MKIELGEYCIRSYKLSDEEALIKYANNYNISRLLRDQFPYPYTTADAETWIKHACNQYTETNFVIATDEEMIGAIGLDLQEDVNRFSAEIGYWIAEHFWGRGIATMAVKTFT
ncbi:MAG: GNAT family N-acetyltransferase [Ignavibacteriaceae bacterium]